MAFDPDKYLAEKSAAIPVPAVAPAAGGFDPDAYLAQKTGAPAEESNIAPMESFMRAGIQVPTLGFGDELAGATQAGMDALTGGAGSISDLKNLYTAYRDMERRKNLQAEKANPKSSMAGTIAGGLATAAIPGLNVASVPGAATMGAVGGLGSSDADLTTGDAKELRSAAIDAGTGAAIGGTIQKVVPVLGKGIAGLRKSLQEGGEQAIDKGATKLYSALSPSTKEMGEFRGSLASNKFGQEVGDEAAKALDDVSLPKLVDKYVNVTGGPEKTQNLIQARINEIEANKKQLFQTAQMSLSGLQNKQIQELSTTSLAPKLSQLADEVALEQNNLGLDQKRDLAEKLRGMFQNYLQPVEDLGGKTLPNGSITPAKFGSRNTNSLMELDTIKKTLGEDMGGAGFSQAQKIAEGLMTDENKAMLMARRRAYDLVRDQMTEVGDIIGGKIGTSIKRANLEESNLIKLRDTADKAASNEAKSGFGGVASGIFGSLGGAAGAAAAGPVGGALGFGAGLAGKSMLEDALGQNVGKAAQVASGKLKQAIGQKMVNVAGKLEAVEPALQTAGNWIADQADTALVSNQSQKSPFRDQKDTSNLATYNNDQLNGVAQLLNNTGDEKLSSYGQSLNKALQSGDNQAKNAAVFLIMQNPKARQHLGLMKK